MKLKELKQMAREQKFDMARVSRVHSSLYRLASELPEQSRACYFDSMFSLLSYICLPTEQVAILSVGTTCQYSFFSFDRFDVLSVQVKPIDWTATL